MQCLQKICGEKKKKKNLFVFDPNGTHPYININFLLFTFKKNAKKMPAAASTHQPSLAA